MAGMARNQRPGLPVATLKPAGSPEVTSSSRCTMQPRVVPTIINASPSVPGHAIPAAEAAGREVERAPR